MTPCSGNKTQHPTIDQKEEGASLICQSTSNEGLSSARGAVQQDSSWGLHTYGPKQLGVAQCEFHHLEEGESDAHTHTWTHARTHAHTPP